MGRLIGVAVKDDLGMFLRESKPNTATAGLPDKFLSDSVRFCCELYSGSHFDRSEQLKLREKRPALVSKVEQILGGI